MVDENKQELFFTCRAAYPNWNRPWRSTISTKHEKVAFNNGRTNAADLLPCVHEEAICR